LYAEDIGLVWFRLGSMKEVPIQRANLQSGVGCWAEPPAGTPNASPRENHGKFQPIATIESRVSAAPVPLVMRQTTGVFGFANVEAIKDKVREQRLHINPYHVHDHYYKTGLFQAIAKHPYFENGTLAVIVLNALWISIDTDLNKADTIADADLGFVVADALFFSYFTIELFIRFCAFEKKLDCFCDGWFMFDSALVILYAFDPFMIGIMAKISGGDGLNLPTAVLRLFRLARLSRLVRMLRSLPELMIMIKGMITAAASVGYTLGLLLVITYVFAIAIRNLVPSDTDMKAEWTEKYEEDLDPDNGINGIESWYFRSVPEAIHNLIIFATFCDDLSAMIIPVKEASTVCMILVWMYIALSSLTVMNMLIGVLCEVISAVAAEEKESMMIDKVKDKFGKIVTQLDTDQDGYLSWDEFQQILKFQEATEALASVNVDCSTLIDVAEDFFWEDGEKVKLDFSQFMEIVLDLRGGQGATVKDVMTFRKRFNVKFMELTNGMVVVENKIAGIGNKLDDLFGAS
jgi:hypothetical protein